MPVCLLLSWKYWSKCGHQGSSHANNLNSARGHSQVLEFNRLNSNQNGLCHDFGLCQLAQDRDDVQGHFMCCCPVLGANTV